MNKKTIIIAFFGLAFCMPAFCQTATPPVNPNADHDRMYRIINESTNTIMPSFAITALKALAKNRGLNENAVLRNEILLKPLYNIVLSKSDRLFAASVLMRMCENPNTTIPADLVRGAVAEISKN